MRAPIGHIVGYVNRATMRLLTRNPQLRALMVSWTAFYTADFAHFTLAVVYCFVFLYLSAAGGGPWSLDAAIRKV